MDPLFRFRGMVCSFLQHRKYQALQDREDVLLMQEDHGRVRDCTKAELSAQEIKSFKRNKMTGHIRKILKNKAKDVQTYQYISYPEDLTKLAT